MKAISTAQHSSVISLLDEGYSLHQIQDRVGLGKSTVGRISKEVLGDKENCCYDFDTKRVSTVK
jgi:uncharacterized protein YerC